MERTIITVHLPSNKGQSYNENKPFLQEVSFINSIVFYSFSHQTQDVTFVSTFRSCFRLIYHTNIQSFVSSIMIRKETYLTGDRKPKANVRTVMERCGGLLQQWGLGRSLSSHRSLASFTALQQQVLFIQANLPLPPKTSPALCVPQHVPTALLWEF